MATKIYNLDLKYISVGWVLFYNTILYTHTICTRNNFLRENQFSRVKYKLFCGVTFLKSSNFGSPLNQSFGRNRNLKPCRNRNRIFGSGLNFGRNRNRTEFRSITIENPCSRSMIPLTLINVKNWIGVTSETVHKLRHQNKIH